MFVLRRLVLFVALLAVIGIPAAPSPVWAVERSQTQPQTGLIEQAARLLVSRFFEPVDSAALFNGAIEGANAELKRQGVNVTLRRVQFTKDYQTDWELFLGAYTGAATAYGSLIDQQELAHGTISGMADGLNDCHTYFLPAAAAQQMQSGLRGARASQGFGFVLRPGADGYPLIDDVYKDSPADKAGIARGDRLISIDDVDVRSLKQEQLTARLRNASSGSLRLAFTRASAPAPLAVQLQPGSYQIPVYETSVLPGGVGYLRINVFAETLDGAAVQKIASDLAAGGASTLLIDLRNNPGGAGTGAIALLSAYVGGGQLLFAHANRDGTMLPMYSNNGPTWTTKPRTAILVNGRTASAGEIVAAVAQDLGVARVFGEKSKGCLASVEMTPLSDGSALGITGARVVTAKNRSLNRVGVTPDVVVDYPVADLMRGVDPQLEKAAEWLRSGR